MTTDGTPAVRHSAYRKWRLRRFVDSQRQRHPIFVLGTQKTGSTAIAALLAAATQQSVTLDLVRAIKDPEWQLRVKAGYETFTSVAYRYRREFKRRIIKEPVLTYFARELRLLYPQSKYVMIQRHPLDTIRSVLNRLQIPGNLVDLKIKRYPELVKVPAWQLAMDSAWLGRPGANYVEALAHRWDLAAREYLTNETEYVLIKYEDFVADRQLRIEALARELGLTVNHDIANEVNTQFQPKGQAVDLGEFFGNTNIQRIRQICGNSAEVLGYTL